MNSISFSPYLPARRAAAVLALCLAAPAIATPARPNFVFVLLDDAGFSDIGAYGGEIATPNMDAIAKAGVRLTNFHTASSCEASRAMLMSGIDNHRAGAGTLNVVIADNQRNQPGYEGHLNERAHSLGRLLQQGGYATYFAGKWNLGDGLRRSPGARGWDRYIALEQTGADNFEDGKVYAPLNREAVRWEDGQRARLPANFYSSRHYTDRLISYIDQGRTQAKPFFAMLALQAVHSPLQAPDSDIDRYRDRYTGGWEAVRAARYRRQVEMGLMPAGLALPKAATSRAWASLSDGERQQYARKMAVFAGMLDNADQQVGRLRAYLKQTGQLDNTVFVVMSDNGADPYELNKLSLPFRLWYGVRFQQDTASLGRPGSYAHYGQEWAEVSNTPFAMFKGTAGEGGTRVPFILSYPALRQPGGVNHAFAHATDFLPTMLDLAGVAMPTAAGTGLLVPTGISLLPHLEGRTPAFHAPETAIGFEATGVEALYKGDYKLMRNGPPYGDGKAVLVNLRDDPTERRDLSASEPARLRELQAELEQYVADNGVVRVPPGFNPLRQLLLNNASTLASQLAPVLVAAACGLAGLLAGLYFAVRGLRRRARRQG